MSRFFYLFFVSFVIFCFICPKQVNADVGEMCSDISNFNEIDTNFPETIYSAQPYGEIYFTLSGLSPGTKYRLKALREISGFEADQTMGRETNNAEADSNGVVTININDPDWFVEPLMADGRGRDTYYIELKDRDDNDKTICTLRTYKILPHNDLKEKSYSCTISLSQADSTGAQQQGCFAPGTDSNGLFWRAEIVEKDNLTGVETPYNGPTSLLFENLSFDTMPEEELTQDSVNGVASGRINISSKEIDKKVKLILNIEDDKCEAETAAVAIACTDEQRQVGDNTNGGSGNFSLCDQIPHSPSDKNVEKSLYYKCTHCDTGDGTRIWTTFGCISTKPSQIIATVIRIGLSITGGVTLLMMLAAGFMYSTSQGDVKRTGEAREMITSAVVGILFIIFSITILEFIGVKILQIPDFGV